MDLTIHIEELETPERNLTQVAGEIQICPLSTPGTVPNTDVLFQRIEELSRNGLAYITHRPFDDGFGTKAASAVMNVFLIIRDMPVLVLTLPMNRYIHLDKVSAYNQALSDRTTKALTDACSERLRVMNGVLSESDIVSSIRFENFIDSILKGTSEYLDNLPVVSGETWVHVVNSFLSSIVLTSSIVSKDNNDALWFLKLQQFCLVTETIENQAVVVKIRPPRGTKELLGDVVGTLKTLGSTFVVMESERGTAEWKPTQESREKSVCSFIMPLAEWRMRLTDASHFPGIIHVAVDLQEPSTVLNNNIRSWIFISDGAVQYGDDPQNYSEESDEQDVLETTENENSSSHIQMQYDASSLGWSSREWSKEDLLATIDEEEENVIAGVEAAGLVMLLTVFMLLRGEEIYSGKETNSLLFAVRAGWKKR